MVPHSGRYYGDPFIVIIGVTQVDPLMYTILNIVVNVVISLWDKVIMFQEEVLEGFFRAV